MIDRLTKKIICFWLYYTKNCSKEFRDVKCQFYYIIIAKSGANNILSFYVIYPTYQVKSKLK